MEPTTITAPAARIPTAHVHRTPWPKGLAAKIARVMGDLHKIEKDGWNDAQKYKYMTESAVTEAARQTMAKHSLAMIASVVPESIERRQNQGKSGALTITSLLMEITWVDGDTGDAVTTWWPGEGQDNGDKGLYKAETGALKYAIAKTFLLSSGDADPEQVNEADREQQGGRQGGRGQDRRQGNQGGRGMGELPQTNQAPKDEEQTAGGKVFPDRVMRLTKKAAGAGLKEPELLLWVGTNIRTVHALGDLTYQEFPKLEQQVDDYIKRKAEKAAERASQGDQETKAG